MLHMTTQLRDLAVNKYPVPAIASLAAKNFDVAAEAHCGHDSFAKVIKYVYFATPEPEDTLRQIMVEILSKDRHLLSKPSIRTIIKSIDGLAHDLLERTGTADASDSEACAKFRFPRGLRFLQGIVSDGRFEMGHLLDVQ